MGTNLKVIKYNIKDFVVLNKLAEKGLSIRNLSSDIKGCYTAKYRYSVSHKWHCVMVIIQEFIRDRNFWVGNLVHYIEDEDTVLNKAEYCDFELEKVVDCLNGELNNIL